MLAAIVRWTFACLFLTACAGPSDVDLSLTIAPETASVLLGVEEPDGLNIRAIDPEGPDGVELSVLDRYVGRYAVRVSVVEYAVPLEALRIAAGPIDAVDAGKPIPRGHLKISEAIVQGDDLTPFEERDELSEAMAAFRMRGAELDECIDVGGCFDRDLADGTACRRPCPTPTSPEPATSPTPPTVACPPGWSGTEACTPFPNGVPTCPEHTTVVPGEATCRAPGPPCPAGEWPEGLSGGNIAFVRRGANGNGTIGDPYGTISSAIGSGRPTIALAKGQHDGDVTLPDGISLVGACASGTHVVGRLRAGGAVEIRNLRVSGPREGIDAEGRGTTLTLSGVIVADTGLAAIDVNAGATLNGDDLLVGPNTKRGLRVTSGASATVSRAVIDRAVRLGVYAQDDTTAVTLADVAILATQPDPDDDDQFGRALDIERGGTVSAQRVFIRGSHNLGVFVADRSSLVLTDGVVSETNSRANDGAFGDGIHALRGGQIQLERVWLDGNRRHQVFLSGETATATLTDVRISNAREEENGGEGSALRVYQTARAHLIRTVVDGTPATSIVVKDPASVITFDDVRVANAEGSAIRIETGAKMIANRLAVENIQGKAINVGDAGASARLMDVRVDDAGGGTCLVCAGICGFDGGLVVGERLEVERVYGRAVNASHRPTSVTLSHLVVRRSFPAPSCTTGFRSPLKGDGAGSIDGGRMVITTFLLEDNPGAAIVVEDYVQASTSESGLFARDGLVRRNTVGANVLVDGFPLLWVTDLVRYEDNESNLNFTVQ